MIFRYNTSVQIAYSSRSEYFSTIWALSDLSWCIFSIVLWNTDLCIKSCTCTNLYFIHFISTQTHGCILVHSIRAYINITVFNTYSISSIVDILGSFALSSSFVVTSYYQKYLYRHSNKLLLPLPSIQPNVSNFWRTLQMQISKYINGYTSVHLHFLLKTTPKNKLSI